MFKRFLRPRKPKETSSVLRFEGRPPCPEGDLAIVGDIHGQLGCLDAMIDHLSNKAPDARWVFVGDLIDRGEHSADVLERILGLQNTRPNTIIILGNHEEMMLSFLRNPEETGNKWMRHGGLQTMASYGALNLSQSNTPEVLRQAHEHLLAAIPSGLEQWLSDRPRAFQSGNVVVVHAGADPTLSIEHQKDQALTWGHVRFQQQPRQDGFWVVHGHTIVDVPQESNGVISVDTGAYATGRLTAAFLHGGVVEFIQAHA